MKTVLTIAGFDPSAGAGIIADLMVFAAHGLFGTACITALTVQSTVGVRSTHPIDASLIAETLNCLQADLPPAGIKIGMLATSSIRHALSDYLKQFGLTDEFPESTPIVLDPVMRSTSGREFLSADGVAVLRDELLPLVNWITPNLDELAILIGEPITIGDDVPQVCRTLQARYRTQDGRGLGIVATGGHLSVPSDFVLTPSGEEAWLRGEHIATTSTHGTGCVFSSALMSRLVLGDSPLAAASNAKEYVTQALRTAVPLGSGKGPTNMLWPFSSRVS